MPKRNRPISERWALYIGRKSRWRGYAWINLVFSMVFFGMYIASGGTFEHFFILGLIWLSLAAIYFERSVFFAIIQAKNAKIKKLRTSAERHDKPETER
jgi:hypothetical protein